MRRQFVLRTYIIAGVIALFAVLLIGKLYLLQIVNAETYRIQAERQYVRQGAPLYDRGDILFSTIDGAHPAAATVDSGYLLVANPSLVDDPEELYAKLASVIPIERDDFFEHFDNPTDTYEEILHRLTEEERDRIEALDLPPGVHPYLERWRNYPGSSLAAHTVGFLGYSGDEVQGLYGLERYYETTLSRGGAGVEVNFFAEIFANLKTVFSREKQFTGDVVTTLEPNVQGYLEDEIARISEDYGSRLTGGIIMNPHTGEIYAMAVHPTFNLNDRSGIESIARFTNPLVERVYEMGSIIKPLTMAAGLDAGVVSAGTTYNDRGSITLNGSTISNYDGEARGVVSMQEVLNQSLNTGVTHVMLELGIERFREYFRAFGLPDETGIDLPNESAGLFDNFNSPRELEYATASFGQGIATTPIATVRALAALANGGRLVFPHLAEAIRYRSGITKQVSYPEGERVIAEETSEEITRMLVEVVDSSLLGGSVKNERYSIAAKTGTAQIARAEGGGYYEDRFLHSFFGYFPAYDPQFLVFLYTVEPQGVRYASHTLTMPFIRVSDFLINYYEIPPDR